MRTLAFWTWVVLAALPSVSSAQARSEVVALGDQYVMTEWTPAQESNINHDTCMSDRTSKFSLNRAEVGVAYNWGGFDTIEGFLQKVEDGNKVSSCQSGGSCSITPASEAQCAAGIDCSGYVSRCWGLTSKYGTSTIHNVSDEIDEDDLKKGDAYNNAGSHIILYTYEGRDGRTYVMESSGSKARTVFRGWTASSLRSYTPRRYTGILEDSRVEGTIDNPIPIDLGGGLCLAGNTRNVVSIAIDSYSAAPETKEWGPEVIYRLNLRRAGKIVAEVTTPSSTIDVDLHLLSDLEIDENKQAVNTIIRHDREIEYTVNAGTYYLVVDTYTSNSRRSDSPGAYSLSLDLK